MKLSELLREAGVRPVALTGEADVACVRDDSRACGPGACFVAVRGPIENGHRFIPSAVAAGCSAVVCEDAGALDADVACAVVGDTRACVGPLAQAILGWPARRLVNVGITGTNGKTTAAHLMRAVLEHVGRPAGLVGTIRYETGLAEHPAITTTPGPVELAGMMQEMLAAGRGHLVMEVSSHALDQRRTAGVPFHVGVFTNLSGDHLDYHGTMEAYLGAKRRLFEGLPADAVAVLNRDEAASEQMAAATAAGVIWYGLSPAADVWARIERIDATGSRFRIVTPDGEAGVVTPLIGRHNVMNCLAAAGAGLAVGIDLPAIAEGLASVASVPGRLERVAAEAPFDVFVDYAHTDDALANVLAALEPIRRGRIILVFGCGGDRDRTKRPRMARVAERHADRVIVTSDNPRTEPPGAIIEEIVAGMSESARAAAAVRVDRGEAIRLAVAEAAPGDIVLIAGKGHETYQDFGDRRVHFSDAEAAAAAVRRREAAR